MICVRGTWLILYVCVATLLGEQREVNKRLTKNVEVQLWSRIKNGNTKKRETETVIQRTQV